MSMKLRWIPLIVCGLALPGCADAARSTAPDPAITPTGVQPRAHDAPEYQDESEVPDEMKFVYIHEISAGLAWNGSTASGTGYSYITANRGTMTLSMDIVRDGQHAASPRPLSVPQWSVFPAHHKTTRTLDFNVGKTCGHVANFRVDQTASNVVHVKLDLITVANDADGRWKSAEQPACDTCSGPAELTAQDASYDPYSMESSETTTSCGGTGGDCETMIIDWYVSYDGGLTWHYVTTTYEPCN